MISPQTCKNNFCNGAFILSRSIFDSDLWQKPPEYIKTWIYLLGKANHKERSYRGYFCGRGQYFCDYQELRDQLKYKIGYRNKQYHENHMKNVMKFLRDTQRITTVKKPRGILVTILNYDVYQSFESYEKTTEEANEETDCRPTVNQMPSSINKNDKELKNEIIKDIYMHWNSLEIIEHREFGKFKSAINARLENYRPEEIKEAMSNYKKILEGSDYYFTYRWSLDEFLSRKGGLDKFMTINKPFEIFRKDRGNGRQIRRSKPKVVEQEKTTCGKYDKAAQVINF